MYHIIYNKKNWNLGFKPVFTAGYIWRAKPLCQLYLSNNPTLVVLKCHCKSPALQQNIQSEVASTKTHTRHLASSLCEVWTQTHVIKTYKHYQLKCDILDLTQPTLVRLPRPVTFRTNQKAATFVPSPMYSVNPVYSKHNTPVPHPSRSVNTPLSGVSCRHWLPLAWFSWNNYHMQLSSQADFYFPSCLSWIWLMRGSNLDQPSETF